MTQDLYDESLIFFIYFLKVAALMASTISHAFVILGMLEGTATEILMTAALLLVITVRLLSREKKIVRSYTEKKANQ